MSGDLDVVIAGGGRVGFETAKLLDDHGHDVTIIERDRERVSTLADEWMVTVIAGDATNPDILEQADVEGADVVAALTGETGLNLAVCLAAEELAGGVRTVARIDRDVGDSYTRFVDSVVYPERAGARVAVNEIVGSAVRTMTEMTGNLDVMLVQVADGAPAAGKDLAGVRLPRGSLVVSGSDGDTVASSETVLRPGDRYVVAVEPEVADEVMKLFRG